MDAVTQNKKGATVAIQFPQATIGRMTNNHQWHIDKY
jgi:hypothetical protein